MHLHFGMVLSALVTARLMCAASAGDHQVEIKPSSVENLRVELAKHAKNQEVSVSLNGVKCFAEEEGERCQDLNKALKPYRQRITSLSLYNSFDIPLASVKIRKFKNLRYLNVIGTDATDLDQFKNLKHLEELDLSNTEVKSLDGIEALINLKILRIDNLHAITDLSPLRDLTKLRVLTAVKTSVEDLEPLMNLSNLEEVHLAHTSISSAAVLFSLPKLVRIHLSYCDNLSPVDAKFFKKFPDVSFYIEKAKRVGVE